MTSPDATDSSRLALREALAALNRGDDAGASTIARAHAAHSRARPPRRVVLVVPLWRVQVADNDPAEPSGQETEESA